MMPSTDYVKSLRDELHKAHSRALKYEQALRKIDYVCGDAEWAEAIARIARAALDKPGTEGENSANEGENRLSLQLEISRAWDDTKTRKP